VAKINLIDEAHRLRIEIDGRFAGQVVDQVRSCWHAALASVCSRKLTVDISKLSGYDVAGSKLLRQMYQHGTEIAARTPEALVFFNEIASPEVKGPTLVYAAPSPEPRRKGDARPIRIAAAGE